MIVAVDVHYRESGAKFVAMMFDGWQDDAARCVYTKRMEHVAPYEPGAFYKRELPCILALLDEIPARSYQAVVIDGFVQLESDRPGLGAHLYAALHSSFPVIGVAKTRFEGCEEVALPLLRGSSRRPLWITAAGIDASVAAALVASMHGSDRMPRLLSELDRLTKAD
ncbi:endonuclease V [Flaviaesturariibacter amylovorans]|uniref:Endonuclease V n=1 Tax=Flaviaesturariibacter amylovorans TaxID=1084520 RepID=A0ABP8GUN0_9BACT